jgi:hypothetical protein
MAITRQEVKQMDSITWERITCDEVEVGDRIARVRNHGPQRVIEIREGQASRRLCFTRPAPGARRDWGQNIRPNRTAKLWRVVEPAGESDSVGAASTALLASPEPAVERVTSAAVAPRIGSPIVAALEDAWSAIQAKTPEVPDVVLIIGSGRDGRRKGLKLGHFARDSWQNGEGRLPEVMIGGEGMKGGAKGVLTTLIHEAAHGLAVIRGIKDTSRQGRYHNKRFKELAEELGLEIAHDPRIGWSPSSMPDATAEAYAATLAALDEALKLYRPDRPEVAATKSTPAAECGCGRKIRVAPSVLEQAPITCAGCGDEFAIPGVN